MTRVHRLRGPHGEFVTIVAGITGLASDLDLVRQEIERQPPSRVLLGVPFEDLDAVRATSGKEQETTFEAGDLDDVYLERLKKYGEVRTPPPDLYFAYRAAAERNVPVDAIDLGDEAYTESYTKNVGFLEVLRSNRRQRQIPGYAFESKDAEAFVREWDEALHSFKGLRRVQEARESSMAAAIERTGSAAGVLALVPLARAQGIVARLEQAGWTRPRA